MERKELDNSMEVEETLRTPLSHEKKRRRSELGDMSISSRSPGIPGTPSTVLDTPSTPATIIDTPTTPETIRLDNEGNVVPGQEEKFKKFDEYNKSKKYKMVPYELPFLKSVYVKQKDGNYKPLLERYEKTYQLQVMGKDDFRQGIQSYDYDGKKLESDNLFGNTGSLGGSKNKRRTKKRHSLKLRYKKSRKMRKYSKGIE
tara:strand:- start:621 stop:1223 length:603 start_codon:yes stop_codon:yes gene_type:complete